MPQIHELMPRIMRDLGAIGKNHTTAATGRYKYRSVEDALNALGPVLVSHDVSTTFCVLEMHTESREAPDERGKPRTIYRTWLRAEVRFHAPDGSSLACVGAGEGLDYAGDKSASKAQSAAYKYAVFLGLSVPLEDGQAADADDGPRVLPTAPLAFGAPIAPPASVFSEGIALLRARAAAAAPTAPATTERLIDSDTIQLIGDQCDRAGVSTQDLIAIIRRRGADRITQLTAAAGAELLAKLSALAAAQPVPPAPFTSPPTAPTDEIPF